MTEITFDNFTNDNLKRTFYDPVRVAVILMSSILAGVLGFQLFSGPIGLLLFVLMFGLAVASTLLFWSPGSTSTYYNRMYPFSMHN